ARLLVRPQRGDAGPEDRASVAQTVLARALRLFVTGQFAAVTRLTLPRTHDNRLVRAMALLRAQATIAQGRAREGQQLLLETLHEVLDCQTYSVLTYLTRESLDAIGETDPGARAAELVERHSLPLVRAGATLTAALTKAETAVLRLLCDGLTREDIGRASCRERVWNSVGRTSMPERRIDNRTAGVLHNTSVEYYPSCQQSMSIRVQTPRR